MAEAIGLISGVLGIVSFFQSNFPAQDPKGAKVQIKAGLGDKDSNLVSLNKSLGLNKTYANFDEGRHN